MNKVKKTALIVLILIVCVVAGGVIYIKAFLPNVPVENMQVQATPERLARGKYLFNNVAGCRECHSERNPALMTMPVVDGTDGQGGEVFDKKFGFPGSFIARNITPSHLKDWTDGEIFRAITSGVSKDGHPLFPLMPYMHFGHADKEDILSIIAYLRTLAPIKNDWPASSPEFPVSLIMHTLPAKPQFKPMPDKKNTVQYGAYLANMANCVTCHTQENKGTLVAGMEFAGGRRFVLPTGGVVSSSNITPDAETGIGSWTKEVFIEKFKSRGDSSYKPAAVANGTFNTLMPWTQFGQMTQEDLSAIYDYLRTVSQKKNKVIKFEQ